MLDLGSGGGLDVLLSARRVGSTGFVYGLDATAEMVELARRNATEAGVGNVEFLHGTIDHVPLHDASVDVVISNCVIVLASDKDTVFAEIAASFDPVAESGSATSSATATPTAPHRPSTAQLGQSRSTTTPPSCAASASST